MVEKKVVQPRVGVQGIAEDYVEGSRDLPLGQAIEDLVLIATASLPGEWEGQVRYLSL